MQRPSWYNLCNMAYSDYSHINPPWLSALTEATTANSLLVVGEGISLTGKSMNLELKSRQSLTAPCRSMKRKAMLSCLSLLIYDLRMFTITLVEKEPTSWVRGCFAKPVLSKTYSWASAAMIRRKQSRLHYRWVHSDALDCAAVK